MMLNAAAVLGGEPGPDWFPRGIVVAKETRAWTTSDRTFSGSGVESRVKWMRGGKR